MDENEKSAVEKLKKMHEILESPAQGASSPIEGMSLSSSKVLDLHYPKIQPSIYRRPGANKQENENEYQSASVIMRAIAEEALAWKEQLPENFRPAIIAIMHGGIQIHVSSLSQVSFHGIRIEGMLNGSPCSMYAHQSTVQILCYGEEIKEPTEKKNPIGFIWEDNKIEV